MKTAVISSPLCAFIVPLSPHNCCHVRQHSGALCGNRMQMTTAINANLSTHTEMLVTGRQEGAGGRPGSVGAVSSVVISPISTNSRSKILLTSLCGNVAT